jgi:hypothetical protein
VTVRIRRSLLPGKPPAFGESVAADMSRQLAAARREGYLWHRRRLAGLPSLRAYVCRPDFLGANAALPAKADLD